jgi:hypothetical protein
MRVHVDSLAHSSLLGTVVSFHTALGSASATWVGGEPDICGTYEVETQIRDTMEWGRTAVPQQGTQEALTSSETSVTLQGELISVDGRAAVLRIGDSLALFEAVGTPPPPGTYVRIEFATLYLYDSNT